MSAQRQFARELDLRDADKSFRQRFWSKVDQRGPDECWPWLAYRKPNNYGQFVLRKGVFITASRVALALTIGRLEAGQVARHACDNPPCCNPAHLLPGTQVENNQDSINRGRFNRAKGEAQGSAKLTDQQVRAIRSTPYRFGTISALAREFGVSDTTIASIRAGETWTHIDTPTAPEAAPAENCKRGHPRADFWAETGTRGYCRRCNADRMSRRYQAKKALKWAESAA